MKITLISILVIFGISLIGAVAIFIITATTSSLTVMELKMPRDGKQTGNYDNASSKLTVVLLKDDMIYGYYGDNVRDGKTFAFTELQKELLEGIKRYSLDSFVVMIKPLKAATYKNTVDVLDAMWVNDIKRFEMLDINAEEKLHLKIDE
jgi:biopolymer transport protein ExbD